MIPKIFGAAALRVAWTLGPPVLVVDPTNYYYEGYHIYLNRHLRISHHNRNLSGSQV